MMWYESISISEKNFEDAESNWKVFKIKKTGGEGIEPPTAVPKTDVLPLHQPPVLDFL